MRSRTRACHTLSRELQLCFVQWLCEGDYTNIRGCAPPVALYQCFHSPEALQCDS